eukprot:COSAG02_NODE_36479_length_454_cov_0.678873_1_plen_27_part_10
MIADAPGVPTLVTLLPSFSYTFSIIFR